MSTRAALRSELTLPVLLTLLTPTKKPELLTDVTFRLPPPVKLPAVGRKEMPLNWVGAGVVGKSLLVVRLVVPSNCRRSLATGGALPPPAVLQFAAVDQFPSAPPPTQVSVAARTDRPSA